MSSPISRPEDAEEDLHSFSSSISSPVCKFHITPGSSVDRFSLMQDLLAIHHEDDTVTLSVRLKKSTGYLEVDVYMRSHSHAALETLDECQEKIFDVAKRYHANIVKQHV